MDVLTIGSGYLAEKLTDSIEGLIKTHVIERWTRHRAIEFYRTFSAELLDGKYGDGALPERVAELLKNENVSEIVFEAYRSVCLAKSKSLGPRIIAIVVAKIVQGEQVADDEEELILAAAETLSDSDLLAMASQIRELSAVRQSKGDNAADWTLALDKRSIDSNYSSSRAEIGAGTLSSYLGIWAERLKSLGLLSESVVESGFEYKADSERHLDFDGSVRVIEWSVHFDPACIRLAQLVSQVTASGDY